MAKYTVKRLLQSLVTILIVVTIVFLLLRMLPTDYYFTEDQLMQEEDFYGQFENKKVDSFTVVKSAPSADNEIEAISGSTITSKAMANGVNACLTYFQNVLAGGTN